MTDLANVKASEDAKAKGAKNKPAEVEIPQVAEGMVKVKNITKANVFASNGKMKPGNEKYVSKTDAKALKEKELCIEVE